MPEETGISDRMPGQLIVLNGASSSGKTSIAEALCAKLDGDFRHITMDAFLNGLPPIGDYNRQRVIEERLQNLADFVGKRLESGQNVILDIVAWQKNIALYEQHRPYLIALKPSLEVLKAREKARGDRRIGIAESQFATIHAGISYDLEIDNSGLTLEQTASKIAEAFAKARLAPSKPLGRRADAEKLFDQSPKI